MNINTVDLYFDLWDKVIFSTLPTDLIKSEVAIKNAYRFLNLEIPNIYFLSSPLSAKEILATISLSTGNYTSLKYSLEEKLSSSINTSSIKTTNEYWYSTEIIQKKITSYCDRGEKFQFLCRTIYQETLYPLIVRENTWLTDILGLDFYSSDFWLYDFYMNCTQDDQGINTYIYDVEIWNIYKSLCEECPYLLSFNDVCLIIDRPKELYLDRELLPHAEGKAAIKFRDEYKFYCNHGTTIPAKYGEIHPDLWESKGIIAESQIEENKELLNTLLTNIGYKKFERELPKQKTTYWHSHKILIYNAINKIIDWHFFHYYDFYHRADDAVSQNMSTYNFQQLTNNLSFKLPQELGSLYVSYNGEYQIAPKLYFYPLEQAIQNQMLGLQSDSIWLFHGDRQEIYYVLCDNEERMISPVYCQFPGEEPIIYAECVTSLIVTIAQCYQEGAYYIAIDEETGERTIEQNLDKIEPIFEKFNPDQIDTWRKIWKS